ncbi:MAG TPA: hypothetical protein VEC12_15500 [Bacteroidia bacterium]|nr:hypothetical protein [Bacteroidia bacterium]
MLIHKFTRRSPLVKCYGKGTDLWAFLQTVPTLEPISPALVQTLATRFGIRPETLELLIHIATTGGAYYAN